MNPQLSSAVFAGLVRALPLIAIWCVGIWISLKYRLEFPQIANLALVGFLLFVLEAILQVWYGSLGIAQFSVVSPSDAEPLITKLRLVNGLMLLLNISAWCLLIFSFSRSLKALQSHPG